MGIKSLVQLVSQALVQPNSPVLRTSTLHCSALVRSWLPNAHQGQIPCITLFLSYFPCSLQPLVPLNNHGPSWYTLWTFHFSSACSPGQVADYSESAFFTTLPQARGGARVCEAPSGFRSLAEVSRPFPWNPPCPTPNSLHLPLGTNPLKGQFPVLPFLLCHKTPAAIIDQCFSP